MKTIILRRLSSFSEQSTIMLTQPQPRTLPDPKPNLNSYLHSPTSCQPKANPTEPNPSPMISTSKLPQGPLQFYVTPNTLIIPNQIPILTGSLNPTPTSTPSPTLTPGPNSTPTLTPTLTSTPTLTQMLSPTHNPDLYRRTNPNIDLNSNLSPSVSPIPTFTSNSTCFNPDLNLNSCPNPNCNSNLSDITDSNFNLNPNPVPNHTPTSMA